MASALPTRGSASAVADVAPGPGDMRQRRCELSDPGGAQARPVASAGQPSSTRPHYRSPGKGVARAVTAVGVEQQRLTIGAPPGQPRIHHDTAAWSGRQQSRNARGQQGRGSATARDFCSVLEERPR